LYCKLVPGILSPSNKLPLEGRKAGRQEGRKAGSKEGRKEGRKEGSK
jgi:hypothetical protein